MIGLGDRSALLSLQDSLEIFLALGSVGLGGIAKRKLLSIYQAVVQTAFVLEETFMSAGFHNTSLLQNNNPVGLLDGRETMGNGDRGAVLSNPVERGLHDLLATNIDGTGGLVKDDNLGLPYNAASNSDTLALATGKLRAAVADGGIVSLDMLDRCSFQ